MAALSCTKDGMDVACVTRGFAQDAGVSLPLRPRTAAGWVVLTLRFGCSL